MLRPQKLWDLTWKQICTYISDIMYWYIFKSICESAGRRIQSAGERCRLCKETDWNSLHLKSFSTKFVMLYKCLKLKVMPVTYWVNLIRYADCNMSFKITAITANLHHAPTLIPKLHKVIISRFWLKSDFFSFAAQLLKYICCSFLACCVYFDVDRWL